MNRKIIASLALAVVLSLGGSAPVVDLLVDALDTSAVVARVGTEWGGG